MDISEEIPYREYALTRASLRPLRSCLPSDSFNHSTIFSPSPSPTPMFNEDEGEHENQRQQILENLIQQRQWEGIINFLRDLPQQQGGNLFFNVQLATRALSALLTNNAIDDLRDNNQWNAIISLILENRSGMQLREQACQALLDRNVINFLMQDNQWTIIFDLALSTQFNTEQNHGPVSRVLEQAIIALEAGARIISRPRRPGS